MNWNISVKNYMGRISDGIFALITFNIDGTIFEATYWYNLEKQVVTISDDMKVELKINDIEEHKFYPQLLEKLKKISVPHADIINSIDEFDLSFFQNINP